MRWLGWVLSLIAMCAPIAGCGLNSGPFPENPDLSTLYMRLDRTGCFGSCPAYSVVVNGSGIVTYVGKSDVMMRGPYTWQIPRERVLELVALFRQADFFQLDDAYEAVMTDLPTYLTYLSIGGRQKAVRDYGGGIRADFLRTGKPMPPGVTETEDAIDRISGAHSFVSGDDKTIEMLDAAGWRFDTDAGARAVGYLVSECRLPLAEAFLSKGAPSHGEAPRTGQSEGGPTIVAAVGCASIDFVRLLESRGELEDDDTARKFLVSSVRAGFPDMVEIGLKHASVAGLKDEDSDVPLIFSAAAADPPWRKVADRTRFDPGAVVTLLVAAGSDPNEVLDDGYGTPLQWAEEESAVLALLKAGADPNVADRDKRTPLFRAPGAGAVRALLAHGANANLCDSYGATPLFGISDPEIVPLLVKAGVDLNAANAEGRTAFLSADTEAAALALVQAGAETSGPKAMLEQRLTFATEKDWPKLAALLRDALAKAER